MTLVHERFITYLLALNLADEQIAHMCVRDNLLPPTPAESCRLRFEMDLPPGFDAFDPCHEPSVSWLRQHGIHGIFQGDAAVVEAFRVLRAPLLRLPVEVLLIGGVSADSTAEFCTRHRLGELNVAGVQRFASLFWATTDVPFDTLIAFLARHPSGAVYREVLVEGSDKAKTVATAMTTRAARQCLAVRQVCPASTGSDTPEPMASLR